MRGSFERRYAWLLAASVIMVFAAGLVPVAQTSTPTQTFAPCVPPQGAPAAPRPGRGGGRGGGRDDRRGGQHLDDPAYAAVDFGKKAPVSALTPEQQLTRFILQPGYRLELVLSDPDIQEPTAINFDGNGRMFVLENRGYMQDLDATGEHDPIGRISLHTDTDGDGVYDKHSVFADKLVFPRFMMPFGPNAILAKESHAQEVWKLTDTNGDGVADKKELFDTGYGRLGNVEHEESFLTYGLDNWLYSTVNAFRARWTPHGVIENRPAVTGAVRTQNDDGKMWFRGRERTAVLLAVPDRLRNFAAAAAAVKSIPTWDLRGARRSVSRTCRAACAPRGCPMDRCGPSPARPATTSSGRTGCRRILRVTCSRASRSAESSGAYGPKTGKA